MKKPPLAKYDFSVIFDMDGVIVDSNPVHKKALKLFCRRHGYHLTEADLNDRIYGRSNKDWLPEFFQLDILPEEYEKLAQEKEILFREMYEPIIQPIKGLINFLENLSAHQIACAIASSAPPENVEFTIQKPAPKNIFQLSFMRK